MLWKIIIDQNKLKIDKYFIDRINKTEIAELSKHFIVYAHTFGRVVIAEGVETEEQLNILKDWIVIRFKDITIANPYSRRN